MALSVPSTVDNEVALFRYGQAALALIHENRPMNSKRAYDPKQKEWEVSSAPGGRRPSALYGEETERV